MEVLAKLKNTVSQLSGVLPGNPVTREFEANRHVGSAGPNLLWKIYEGCKKSTRQEAAIFVLEKKALEKYSKRDRELILESLRKGIAQLTRLRHPKILTVQHPLEESRESLAFATEPVFCSLANAIGFHENMPSPVPPEIRDYQLYEVEIKYGILQLCEALTFLHGDVRLLHRNICPESIIINKSGSWKLSGFEFCVPSKSPPDQPPSWPFHEWEADIHCHAQPPLAYLAPEYALTLSCDSASDMFSLGSVIYSVFNGGKMLTGACYTYSAFKKNACELKNLSLTHMGGVPPEVREHVKLLLNVTPELRPDAHQFSKIPFFEDVGAKALEYLDSLFQWDNLQKSQFYKGLPQVITKMPKRVNLYRIIPCLGKEFVNPEMIPFVLPSVLLISEDATKEEFCSVILPELRPIFKIQEPIQILLIFMQKMELLLNKTPPDDIKAHVLPMVYRALESETNQIQELCLNIIPNFANLVDYPSMKNALIPRIKKVCLTTPYLSVRVNCLVCLGKLLEHLDKWLVLDDVLPMLPEIPSREPAVLMGILGIYKLTMTNKKLGITKDVMATKVIPFLMPLTIESGLNLSQFNATIAVVKEMVNRVELDHRAKLEQLNSMQQEQRTSLEMSKITMPNKSELISGMESKAVSETDQMWQTLGLGTYVKEKDVSRTADEILPIAPNSSNVSAVKPTLSMEDKERIAREQDRHQQLKSQAALRPSAATKPAVTSAVASKDITDKLISSNLANMNLNRPNAAAPNYNINLANMSSSATNTMMQPVGVIPNYALSTAAFPSPQQSTSMFQTNGSTVAWGMNNPSGGGVQQMKSPNSSLRPSLGQQQSNLSAFDNLLVAQQSRPKIPMNQMSAVGRTRQPGPLPPFTQHNLSGFLTAPTGTPALNFSFPPPPPSGPTNVQNRTVSANTDLNDLLG